MTAIEISVITFRIIDTLPPQSDDLTTARQKPSLLSIIIFIKGHI